MSEIISCIGTGDYFYSFKANSHSIISEKPAAIKPPPKILLFFFAAIITGIVFLMVMSYQSHRTFKDTSYLVKHTQTVLDEAEQAATFSKDLQLESGGYYLTGDSSFLKSFATTKSQALNQIGILKMLTADNAMQQQRVDALRNVLQGLIAFSDSSIELRTLSKPTLADVTLNVTRRKIIRAEVDNLIATIRAEEKKLLAIREVANDKSITTASFIFYSLTGFIFILLIATFLVIIYYFKKRKRAEEAMRESEARFRLLINNIKDYAIYMMDARGYITNWYSGAAHIKGYTYSEIIGKHMSLFYPKEEIEKGTPEYNLKMAAEKSSYETEGWRVRKDGSRFWADEVIRAVYDENKQVIGFTKVTRDYTLHKQAEDNMRQALQQERELSEMKSNFVVMASHEFRTPLSAILSSASLIEQYKTTDQQDKRERHVRKIQSSVTSLTTLLEEFLSLERIEQGKVAPKVETFNLKTFTTVFCNEMKNVAKPGQTISYHHNGEEWVHFDPAFFRHILANLTSNAIKYSPENSPIQINTAVADGSFWLHVKDQGMGISAEAQKRLFERFYRASNVINIQGTGLGLHIVKQYVDLVHGKINVKSEEGKGSEFVVQLKNQRV